MPILRDGPKDRPNVSAALLADIVLKMQAAMAFVEFVGARPGEGAVGGLRLRQVPPRRHRRRLWRCWRSALIPDAIALEAACRHPAGEGRREGRRSVGGASPLAWPCRFGGSGERSRGMLGGQARHNPRRSSAIMGRTRRLVAVARHREGRDGRAGGIGAPNTTIHLTGGADPQTTADYVLKGQLGVWDDVFGNAGTTVR
jgi:hypothetical protein